MELVINHHKKSYDLLPLSLEVLLHSEIPGKQKGIAVALNHEVVARNQWASTFLQHNDHILIITATQGG